MAIQIEALLKQMTLQEKISILAGADMWHTVPIDRLGIPAIKMSDGPNGARGAQASGGPTSACFPAGVALGATWNPELVERVGQALAEEVKSKGAHILLAPTVNIHRSPLAGRNFECYSEDPYLTSRLAVAYINGLQRQGVGACIKHFVCNDSEFERHSISSEVRERALREIYLPPFRSAVNEAHPWAVMSSYNKINGVYASENKYILLEILKEEWGFEGIVISDWYGTYGPDVAAGGLDLEMPGPARWMGEHVLQELASGKLDQQMIDDKVCRLLETIAKAGAFEHPQLHPEQAVDKPEHRRLIREAAGEAIVLLKNEDELLPLNPDQTESIAVIGENARWAAIMGGGSAAVAPHYVISPLEGIRNHVGDSVKVDYEIGCSMHRMVPLIDADWLQPQSGEGKGLTLEYFNNPDLAGEPIHTEVSDRMSQVWFGKTHPYVDLDNFSVRLRGTFTAPEAGIFQFGLASVGESHLFIDGNEVITNKGAAAEGDSFSGEGERTFEIDMKAGQSFELVVEFISNPGAMWRNLRLGCMPPIPVDPMGKAVALAAKSEVAIVFAGLTSEWEGEGADRPDMDLPGDQAELIKRVAEVNPNTIVVINSGGPINMPWLADVGALLQAWYPGQEAGNAIADVLFGEVNPSGRLPYSYPRRLQDTPSFLNYPGENGKVFYGEGIFVGYRYYDKKDISPLFPFGYGLSYTSFNYRKLTLDASQLGPGGKLQASLELENTGDRAGKEVVQLYVRDVQSRLVRPEKELKAFAKVELQPGEVKTISFTLKPEALAYYDPDRKEWYAEPGEFELMLGRSAQDIRLRQSFFFREQ